MNLDQAFCTNSVLAHIIPLFLGVYNIACKIFTRPEITGGGGGVHKIAGFIISYCTEVNFGGSRFVWSVTRIVFGNCAHAY